MGQLIGTPVVPYFPVQGTAVAGQQYNWPSLVSTLIYWLLGLVAGLLYLKWGWLRRRFERSKTLLAPSWDAEAQAQSDNKTRVQAQELERALARSVRSRVRWLRCWLMTHCMAL